MQFSGLNLSGITVGAAPLNTNYGLLTSAQIYFSAQTAIGSSADGTSIGSLTNLGVGGSTYTATAVAGYTQPTASTFAGQRMLRLDGYGSNQLGYDLATGFSASGDASLFVVTKNLVDSATYARVVGFGGQSGSYQNCFFGNSTNADGSGFLFRDTGDNGMSLTGLTASTGIKVFGMVKTGSSIVYYDNSTTPVSWGGTASGTYFFNTVGYRWFSNPPYVPQPSTGYLGDVAWYNTALSGTDAATVMTTLKARYNIA
jgi:hypothetical protein